MSGEDDISGDRKLPGSGKILRRPEIDSVIFCLKNFLLLTLKSERFSGKGVDHEFN